jgi:TM2 domain-containing membrane protein YozV
MGILIMGIGHMVVGRVARGILIFAGGWVIGFVGGLIGGLILALILAIPYWIFQLIDLYKQIHRMEVVKT